MVVWVIVVQHENDSSDEQWQTFQYVSHGSVFFFLCNLYNFREKKILIVGENVIVFSMKSA